jgi:hypothetical protein
MKLSKKLVKFIKKQPKPFKVNMARSSSNAFLTKLTDQFRSIYVLRLGATPFQLGLVTSIGGVAGAIIALPTGLLADRQGIRKMFLFSDTHNDSGLSTLRHFFRLDGDDSSHVSYLASHPTVEYSMSYGLR